MTRIAGRYEIASKLGEGGMGVVFRAYDPAPMDREVAVKTLHEFSDPLALELFYKECTALKSISHPNIVEIFDMGEYEEDGHKRPFFVMPLLPGESLDQLIRRASHRLTVDRVVEIFAQTCRGLHAAHEHGLVHRDLKPSNIFVMADDSVKIIDFGVAHAVHARSRTTGYDKGTLLYMAPEQVQHKPVSIQSDIYSLGVTLYEALTRRQPFRGATEDAVIQSILSLIPPPASELNPAVSHVISRVVHKAMAKQPWNRFDTAKEFGDTLQKAYRNEAIAIFDPSRTQPRIQTATKALEKGDFQFAGEIVSELEAEGNIDPQITMLRAQIDQVARQKTIGQLLESARARYEEDEDPLALQKLQEVLQLDPTNVTALGLKSKIEDRRSERQIEKWIQLARQHVDNHSYGHAREALQNALVLRPKDPRATRLLKEIEGEEQEYVRVRREKTDLYQAAVNAWKNGEVSQALSQMKHVLDLDQKAPDASSPDAAGVYQSFYNKLRSEHDSINTGYADARRQLSDGQLGKALQICQEFLTKYPGLAVFQALKFDIEEQQRQQLSAFIADVDRRVESEPDLNAKVHLVRDALAEYPDEDHFVRLSKLLEDKRDLVNSIVERARVHEGAGQIAEAINDLDTLQTIYPTYPGLKFERDRLQKRLEQQTRETARAKWVRQIDGQLEVGDYARAFELLDMADGDFPADAELAELRKLATQGKERASRADQLVAEGQQLCAQGQFDQGVDLLQIALQLDDRTGVRMTLRDLFVARAQESLNTDWRAVEQLADRALEIDPNHALAKSLRAQALDQKREEVVGRHAEQARRLQADGHLDAAMSEVEAGLAVYPNDTRLTVIADALKKDLGRAAPPPALVIEPAPAAPAPPAIERTRLVPQRHAQSGARAASPDIQPVDGLPEVGRAGTAVVEPVAPSSPRPAVQAPATRASSLRWPIWIAGAAVIVGAAGVLVLMRGEQVQPPPDSPPSTAQSEPAAPALPSPTPSPPATPPEPAAPTVANLVLQQLPPGMSVRLDDMPIGTVGANGTLSYTGVAPGRHALQFVGRGYEPLTLSQDFTSEQTLTLSSAEVKLVRSPATVDLRGDPGTELTITQGGRTIQQVKAPARITLPEGKYDLTAKGLVGVPTTRPLVVSADASATIDVRNLIVTGMERFDPAGWTEADAWSTRRGGNFVLYNRAGSQGTISFTIRLDRSGNPFSSGSRLKWVVGYADSTNYVMLQLDKDAFYRSVVTNGTPQPPTTQEHRIPDNVPYVNLRVQLAGNRLVHEFATQTNVWQVLDNWSTAGVPVATKREILDGQFGFFLPGAEEIAISNFRYYPPVTPSPTSPTR